MSLVYLLNQRNEIVYRRENDIIYYSDFDIRIYSMKSIIADIIKHGSKIKRIGFGKFQKRYSIYCHQSYISGIFINDVDSIKKCTIAIHPAHTFKVHDINYIFELARYNYSPKNSNCVQQSYDYRIGIVPIIHINVCKLCKAYCCDIYINENKQDICSNCNDNIRRYLASKYKLTILFISNIGDLVWDIQLYIINLLIFI